MGGTATGLSQEAKISLIGEVKQVVKPIISEMATEIA
jgi:hypothetical protein